MPNLNGSKTEVNLLTAFAGESQAHNKYTYFASKARKDGYEEIADYFLQTAENEKEHAKIWFKLLNDGEMPSTEENLRNCAAGEHEEWTDMYAGFAETAKVEGFGHIAFLFESVGRIEKTHEARFLSLLKEVEDGTVFADGNGWKCRNCGFPIGGTDAPEKCPVCDHPKGYFERL